MKKKIIKDIILEKTLNYFPHSIKKNQDIQKLLLIRSCEFAFVELSKLGKIRGPLHTSVGQEAVAVAVCSSLKKNDAMFSNHRGHGHYIAKNGNVTKLVLELFGDKRGCSSGLGGSMHVAELEKNIIGSNGIVGAGVPIACGYSLGQKNENTKEITVVFFGDGAMNQGVVMESLNLAAIYNLPILLICENNYYAYSTKSKDMSKTKLYERAKGFGIESYNLDGMNLLRSKKFIQPLINKIRNKSVPIFIEFNTYRYHRHFSSEMARKNDYIDIKMKNKMTQIDPCFTELKKFGLNRSDVEKLILNLKNEVIKQGLNLIKK